MRSSIKNWKNFLHQANIITDRVQGHNQEPIAAAESHAQEKSRSYSLRCRIGAVGTKLRKSAHPLRAELCLLDLVDDAEMLKMNHRTGYEQLTGGGLTDVNAMTHKVFRAMELRIRQLLRNEEYLNFVHTRMCCFTGVWFQLTGMRRKVRP